MFLSVIACNVIAVLFAACGVINVVIYVSGITREMGYGPFIEGLAVAAWPLAVAGVLCMLIQTACMIERMLFTQTNSAPTTEGSPLRERASQVSASASQDKPTKAKQAKPAEPHSFFSIEDDLPVSNPYIPRSKEKKEAITNRPTSSNEEARPTSKQKEDDIPSLETLQEISRSQRNTHATPDPIIPETPDMRNPFEDEDSTGPDLRYTNTGDTKPASPDNTAQTKTPPSEQGESKAEANTARFFSLD